MAEFRKLTSEEIFLIFKEEHRICSPLDPEADPSFDFQPTSTIADWLDASDSLPWMELRTIYNDWFGTAIPIEEWRSVAGFSNEKTMQGVFDLLAAQAKIEIIKPLKILGHPCLSAAVFKSLKNGLSKEGFNTTDLSPSSKIEPLLKKNLGQFLSYINKNFTGVIPEIKKTETVLSRIVGFAGLVSVLSLVLAMSMYEFLFVSMASFILAVTVAFIENRKFNQQEGMLTIPGIVTFRDLINRIVESKTNLNPA